MGARLEAAKLLDKGNTYEEILKKINISSSTLSRVSKAFKDVMDIISMKFLVGIFQWR